MGAFFNFITVEGVVMEELKDLLPLLSLLVAVLGFYAGRLTASKNEGKQEGTILVELGNIKGKIDRMDDKMDKQDAHYTEVMIRITAVEESAKQAHLRIDEIRAHCCGD